MFKFRIAIFSMLVFSGLVQADFTCKKISGSVERGQFFQAAISPTLNVLLIPTDFGWDIAVKTSSGDNDFADITMPYRGPNTRNIIGSNFRNVDNSGPNEPGPKNNNAPTYERRITFATNDSDYKLAWHALSCGLSYNNSSFKCAANDNMEKSSERFAKLPLQTGLLKITDIELGNTDIKHPPESVSINKMNFTFECVI